MPRLCQSFLLVFFFISGNSAAFAKQQVTLTQQAGDLIEIRVSGSGKHKLEIDDASSFQTPVVTRIFNAGKFQLNANDVGLIPGVDYHARVDRDPRIVNFRLHSASFSEAQVNCATLRRTWESKGRLMTGVAFSGVRWDETNSRWAVIPHEYLTGQSLYYAELYLRPAVNGAWGCHDLRTLDEVAQYYLLMLKQTETLGRLLSRPNVLPLTVERMSGADRSARTFPAPFGDKAGELELGNVQWLNPAAKLVRLISLLPDQQRTPAMKDFAVAYTRFIVADQLDRYLVQQKLAAPGGGNCLGRIELWKLAMQGLKGIDPWDTAMSDIDLWILTAAAEVLGAHANDPNLASLDGRQLAMLHSALDTGVRFFKSKRTDYPETKNFQGERVGSVSYFNGDYTAHSEYAYSAVTSEEFPAPEKKRVRTNASWDTGHAYRLPIFLRSLYENRKATQLGFPSYRDLQLVSNQYIYQVFDGNYSRPLFHNYLDGSDGWHRVGFINANFGYPPSKYCDMQNPNRPCMTPVQVVAWGLLGFTNKDFAKLEQALVGLAFDQSPDAIRFRNRYYYYSETPYGLVHEQGSDTYGAALYFVIADNSEMISDRPQQ